MVNKQNMKLKIMQNSGNVNSQNMSWFPKAVRANFSGKVDGSYSKRGSTFTVHNMRKITIVTDALLK